MKSYLDAAILYHRAGLKIIPFWNRDAGKKSFPSDYAKYREAQSEEDVNALFSKESDGICLLCTDGIEAIDIDKKHDPKGTIMSDLISAIDDFGVTLSGVVQATKSGGAHIIYRTENPGGNQKLAHRAGEKEAMIETRGLGGLLFVWPSPGYEITSGDIFSIPSVPRTERDGLIALCRHLDESVNESHDSAIGTLDTGFLVGHKAPRPTDSVAVGSPGKSPLDDYNEKTDILDLVQKYGWTVLVKRGDYVRLNRPGAKNSKGVDGSIIVSTNLFYPFSSSAGFHPNKGYKPSGFYAISAHNGDFHRAAKHLYDNGFGDRVQHGANSDYSPAPGAPAQESGVLNLITDVEATRFNPELPPIEPRPLLVYDGGRNYKVAGRGMVGLFTGHEKSGKSFVLSCIAASALKGSEVLNFNLDLDGGTMLLFDTEQSGYFFWKTQERLFKLAGINTTSRFAAYHLRKFKPAERIAVIEHYVYNTPNLSVVIIDGFVDLMSDYNDLKQAQEFVGKLMKWSDEKKVLILGVLHLNKGDGKVRGHIGSELKNKADFVINTAKNEGGIYSITNTSSRYVQIPDMDFTRNEEGLPVYRSFYEECFSGVKSSQFPLSSASTQFPTIATPARPSLSDEDIPF